MTTGHHRRTSSYWTPGTSFPFVDQVTVTSLWRRRGQEESRLILPNPAEDCSRYKLPNYIKYESNEISTTKYNPITFIPRNLWEQFHRLANIYFVFIIVVDFIPLFQAFTSYISALPVVFIFMLTAVKDALEDMRRRRLDSKVNNATCHVWDNYVKRFRKMKWKHILVGDIVHISNDELLPADILLLRTSSEDGNAFVETSNLDGESNLKHKVVPNLFSEYCGDDLTLEDSLLRLKLVTAPPSKDVNEMRGTIELDGKSESFTPANTLLRGCRLKNTTFAEGIVVYAGHDTKVMLSSGRAPYKRSHAERQTNVFVLGCAVMLMIIIALTVLFRILWLHKYQDYVPFALMAVPDWLASWGTSLVMYQIMIPLALYITVELIKVGQVYFMQQDIYMYSEEKDEAFVARSLSMGEELGQLTHLLSDKTGTLTQNKMLLKRCATVESEVSLAGDVCLAPDKDADFEHLLLNMMACNTVFVQYAKRHDAIEDQDTPMIDDIYSVGAPSSYAFSESDLLDEELRLMGYVDLLYEGESPDELALVRGVRKFGYHLTSRSNNSVTFVDASENSRKLEILCTLPFDTVRKRMSVCVVGDTEDEVIVYSKGADSSMMGPAGKRVKKLSESALKAIQEEDENEEEDGPEKLSREERIHARVDEYARMGLRTLVMGMRKITRTEFEEWYKIKTMVEMTRGDEESERMLRELADRMETPTKVIGVTAVEDKLQVNVEQSIRALREAKIQVWVLTGDKKETAEGVATACGLFNDVPIDYDSDSEDVYAGKDVVISTEQITKICDCNTSGLDRLDGCFSVLCYRLTPGQKAEIVNAVKRRGGVVAAIGDGANDVPMIQAAHVGIGMSGNEGSQASMAADFVLAQFSFVSRLILLHGHWNYSRIAHVMLFFFYKNVQNVMMNFFIQVRNGWSCAFPINVLYSVIYPVIFTSVQPIVYGVLDQDLKEEVLLKDPTLYAPGRDGKLYNIKLFIACIIEAVWQSAICSFLVYLYITDSIHSTEYHGFCLSSSMFLVNMTHLLLETRCFNIVVVGIHLLGAAVNYSFFLVYDTMPGDELFTSEAAFSDLPFYAVMLLCIIVALTPRLLIRVTLQSDREAGQLVPERTDISLT